MISLSETLFSIEKESSEKLRHSAYHAINGSCINLTFCLAEKFVSKIVLP